MKILFLIPLLFLMGCADSFAVKAKTELVGTTLPDVISCAGKPDRVIAINKTDIVIQYDQDTPVQPSFSIGTSKFLTLGLGSVGQCHMTFRIHDGYVGSIHYTGPTWTFAGRLSACAPLIDSCSRKDHTVLDDNYNQFKVLGVTQP